jgi:NAD(P)H-flavin reductase
MATARPEVKGDAPTSLEPMTPSFFAVKRRVREMADVVTIEIPIKPQMTERARFQPGQFNMLYAFGVGEVAISISGDPAATDRIVHTIRAVGPVSEALTKLTRNELVGVRGPFGSNWPVDQAAGCDVLVIAGGIGLAPLRPVLYHLVRAREHYGRVALLYGARSPKDLLFRRELDAWRRTPDLQVRVTVDRAGQDWIGDVGVVTKLLPKIRFDPVDTVAMICGPEVMIRLTAAALEDLGVASERIFVSLERNMKCAIGSCGHCQFGPHFLCKDGPIFGLDRIEGLLRRREI